MIVLDASAVVELLTGGELAGAIHEELEHRNETLLVPHLIDVEVVSAIRRMLMGRRIDPHWSRELLVRLTTLPVESYLHAPLLGRIWELRNNFTAYDAAYALAEATQAILFTCDEKLRSGHRARVQVFA